MKHELEVVNREASINADIRRLQERYPSAKKETIEQVLQYVKNHGVGFSLAFTMMEQDKKFLSDLGIEVE